MKHLLKTALLCSSLVFIYQSNAQEYNPYESIGQEAEVLTLTKGKYLEFFDLDSIEIIGDAILNTNTMKVIGFVEHDTLYSEATLEPEIVSRWWAPDPVMQPHQSPYLFVANNPIIYVDQNGEDNTIYLVALKSGKSHFSTQDIQSIADKANKIYEDMGLNTRVVVFESNDPFDPAHLDPSDSYALIGSVSELGEAVKGDSFSQKIKDAAANIGSNADESANDGKGILISTTGNSRFAKTTGESEESTAAFLIVHGGGHNIGFNHTSADVNPHQKLKKEGDPNFTSENSIIMATGDKIEASTSGIGGVVPPIQGTSKLSDYTGKNRNSIFIAKMRRSFFGNNQQKDNYSFNKISKERVQSGGTPLNQGLN